MALPNLPFKGRTPQVVAIIPSYIASCQINVVKPLTALDSAHRIKFKHVLEQNATSSHIAWADLVVFCRNTEPGYRHLLSEAIGKRKPVIYDIDDSFWDISASTDPDLARYHLQPLRLKQLEVYLSYASLVRVYSPLLCSRVSRFNDSCRIYRSSFDFSKLPETTSRRSPDEKVSIVYATSRIVDDQYKVFLPALAEFMSAHHDKVDVTIWGCSPPELLTLPGVTSKKLVDRYDDFLKEFARSGFEIGLAPLEDHEFNRSKNNTKFRDYGACRIAGIYSEVDAYASSVTNEQDGLLVPNTKQAWHAALERLAFEPELRKTIQNNAREKVFQDYRQELIEKQWIDDIEELLSEAPSFLASNAKNAAMLKLPILAENDGWSGIELQNVSPNRGVLLKDKIYLEVQSTYGSTIREGALPVTTYDTTGGSISFDFEPIRHSKGKTFELRIAGLTVKSERELPYTLRYLPSEN